MSEPNEKVTSVFDQLANGATPNINTPASKAAKTMSSAQAMPDTTTLLTELLIKMAAKEARELEKQELEIANAKQKDAQRAKSVRGVDLERIAKQARCSHKKGSTGVRGTLLDYNVSMHTYPDNTTVITCLTCKAKWRQGDTPEYFLRNGRRISNHTHTGWIEARAMTRQTSNTWSSSQVHPDIHVPGASERIGSRNLQDGAYEDNQIRDIDGEVVHNFVL